MAKITLLDKELIKKFADNELEATVDADKLNQKIQKATKSWSKAEKLFLERAIHARYCKLQEIQNYIKQSKFERAHQKYDEDEYGSGHSYQAKCKDLECPCQNTNWA